jgi:hypothetical protein
MKPRRAVVLGIGNVVDAVLILDAVQAPAIPGDVRLSPRGHPAPRARAPRQPPRSGPEGGDTARRSRGPRARGGDPHRRRPRPRRSRPRIERDGEGCAAGRDGRGRPPRRGPWLRPSSPASPGPSRRLVGAGGLERRASASPSHPRRSFCSGTLDRQGLRSRIGVPSSMSRPRTRRRGPSRPRSSTTVKPIGLGRRGDRVAKTPWGRSSLGGVTISS